MILWKKEWRKTLLVTPVNHCLINWQSDSHNICGNILPLDLAEGQSVVLPPAKICGFDRIHDIPVKKSTKILSGSIFGLNNEYPP